MGQPFSPGQSAHRGNHTNAENSIDELETCCLGFGNERKIGEDVKNTGSAKRVQRDPVLGRTENFTRKTVP